jgi:hypothetical protein
LQLLIFSRFSTVWSFRRGKPGNTELFPVPLRPLSGDAAFGASRCISWYHFVLAFLAQRERYSGVCQIACRFHGMVNLQVNQSSVMI